MILNQSEQFSTNEPILALYDIELLYTEENSLNLNELYNFPTNILNMNY